MNSKDFIKQFRANYPFYKESCCAAEKEGKFFVVPIDRTEGLNIIATFVILEKPIRKWRPYYKNL